MITIFTIIRIEQVTSLYQNSRCFSDSLSQGVLDQWARCVCNHFVNLFTVIHVQWSKDHIGSFQSTSRSGKHKTTQSRFPMANVSAFCSLVLHSPCMYVLHHDTKSATCVLNNSSPYARSTICKVNNMQGQQYDDFCNSYWEEWQHHWSCKSRLMLSHPRPLAENV